MRYRQCHRRRIRQASTRWGESGTCCALRWASFIALPPPPSISSRCPKERRSERWRSTLAGVRYVCPACRRARPAHCATTLNGRCCALSKMPACSAGCARRPAPNMSLRSNLSSILAPPGPLPASLRRRSRFAASAAASRSASRARSSACCEARRQALDVYGLIPTPRSHQDVRRLPCRRRRRGEFRSLRRAEATRPYHRRLSA